MQLVNVAWTVTQVTDGSAYRGVVTINGMKFEYDFGIKVPIQQWTEEPNLPTPEAVCDFYRVQLKRDGSPLDLVTLEQLFFVSLLVEPVMDFYHDPQWRDLNASGVAELVARDDGSVTFSCTSPEVGIDLRPEYRELLAGPKFGCSV